MAHIGIYLGLPPFSLPSDINNKLDPLHYNPGMGGSEYQGLLLCQYLHLLTDNRVTIFCGGDGVRSARALGFLLNTRNSKPFRIHEVYSLVHALQQCNQVEVDIFIYISIGETLEELRAIKSCIVPVIAWPTNPDWDKGFILSKIPSVRRVVNPSVQQLDSFKYSGLGNRMCVINNIIPPISINSVDESVNQIKKVAKDRKSMHEKIIAFMGALTKYKGIFEFLEIAAGLCKRRSDIKFLVIGSSDLYSSKKSGTFIDESILARVKALNITEAIQFANCLGDKSAILSKCLFAISNPTANETFCVSAVEFNQQLVPVLCPNAQGYLTSMTIGLSGIPCSSFEDYLSESERILDMSSKEYMLLMGNSYINSLRFLPSAIIAQWDHLIKSVVLENLI